MLRINCNTAPEYYEQQTIRDKLQGYTFTHPKCMGSVLVELALELKMIKEEFISTGGKSDIVLKQIHVCRLRCTINQKNAQNVN